jgi:YesN/AraC family two-component response regulator
LRSLVDGYNHLEVVGEASNGLEAIDAVRTFMDINIAKDEWRRGYQSD